MCTVVVAYKYFSTIPLIIAANRDESLNRDTDPPAIINNQPKILAPRDRSRGGTFIGVNQWGLTAAITNLSGIVERDVSKRSRGLIVLRALRSPNIDSVLLDFKHIDFSNYNLFQLLVADRHKIAIVRYNGEIRVETFQGGLFTLSNWDAIEEVRDYKHSMILSKINTIPLDADIETVSIHLKNILSIHDGKDMRFQVCVHTDNYGTLSSSIIAPFQTSPIFLYSIGPVCSNRFRSYNDDLKDILSMSKDQHQT